VLQQLAASITEQLRKEDILARYGGEEFAIILRGLDADLAFQFCERIRLIIEKLRIFFQETELNVTISLGLTSYEPKEDLDTDEQLEPSGTGQIQNKAGEGPDPDELITLADVNLYKAKQGGRNRTVGP
jgi:diguanylate cyclase (GGDEF)-like protein